MQVLYPLAVIRIDTDMSSQNALIVFIKTPKKGFVKTRLGTHLKPNEILNLYQAFLKDIDHRFSNSDKFDLWYAISPDNLDYELLAKHIKLNKYILQNGDSLGSRMNRAFEMFKEKTFSKMVVVGSDIPNISEKILNNAFSKLDTADCVLGPTNDGGYYLIGLKQPQYVLFQDIDWSTNNVFKQTLEKAKKNHIGIKTLSTLNDIDTFEDLQTLKNMLEKSDKAASDFPTETWNVLNKLESLQ